MFASKEEQRGLITFLVGEGVGVGKVHRRIKVACGEDTLSFPRVQDWHKCFRAGSVSVNGDARPGQDHLFVASSHLWYAEKAFICCSFHSDREAMGCV